MNTTKNVALVTGASRGIGLATALVLGRNGHTVIGTATTKEGVERLQSVLDTHHVTGCAMLLDICDGAAIDKVVEAVGQRFSPPLILVNNAGIAKDGLLIQMSDEEWQQVIDTNLTGVFRLCRRLVRAMIKARQGRIINIGSVIGRMGNAGQLNYASSKAGLEGLTRSLARELGVRNITVNCVAPGFIDTDMTKDLKEDPRNTLLEQIPLRRLGKPEDVAELVAFLASPAASYITGAVLPVNGGLSMI